MYVFFITTVIAAGEHDDQRGAEEVRGAAR